MPKLMIDCPVTGYPIYAGVDVPVEAFRRHSDTRRITYCPYCDVTHEWDKADAYSSSGNDGQGGADSEQASG